MQALFKSRLIVYARGIELMVRELCARADAGDQEAERALVKLRDALDTVNEVLGETTEKNVDGFLAMMEGLKILEEAVDGRSEYSIEALIAIAKQAAEDCRRLGYGDLDISWLFGEQGAKE